MIKDTDELINELNKIKDSMIESLNMGGSDNNRVLSDKLLELSAKDTDNAELYQLISLLNSNIDTDHIQFKKKVIQVANQIINANIDNLRSIKQLSDDLTLNNIKTDKVAEHIDKHNTGFKIPHIGIIKIKDILVVVLVSFIILFLAYSKDFDATSKSIDTMQKAIHYTQKKEK